jgi:hypothetical protein
MKTLVAIILPVLVMAGCKLIEPPPPPPPPPASGIGFLSNCEIASGALVATGQGDDSRYIFTLKDKDIGGCAGDDEKGQNAPYFERAELRRQGHIDLKTPQIIKFEARFLDGFSGKQESFFQIHNYNASCIAHPSLMIKWHKGDLELSLLQESGFLKPKRYPGRHVRSYRSWSTWQIRLARKSRTRLAIDVMSDGERIGRGHIAYVEECGTPYVKFGIFRPGNTWSGNETSIAEFRNFSLKPLYPPKPQKQAAPLKPIVPPMMLKKPPKKEPVNPPMMITPPKSSKKQSKTSSEETDAKPKKLSPAEPVKK